MKKKTIFIIAGCIVAVALLGIVILMQKPSAQSCYEKGRHALLTGNYEEAQKYLNQAIEINKDKSPALDGEVLMSLAECSNRQGDSVQAIDYTRQAALKFNQDAQSIYGDYLDRHKELKNEFISYYSFLNGQSPQESKYAGKLARIYITDENYRDYNKAGELLMPFISKSGSGDGDPNTIAYAACLLALGEGGYPESPEVAVMLGSKCIRNINSVIENPAADSEALFFLGNMALAECAYDANSNMYDNVVKAYMLYEAAIKNADGFRYDMLTKIITWLDDFRNEAQKVSIDPNWWDKKPNDWTRFYNHETGFRYLGHTNYSGYKGAYGGTEYPTGWGIGAWTKEGNVFLGKWNAGNVDKGVYIHLACLSSIYE